MFLKIAVDEMKEQLLSLEKIEAIQEQLIGFIYNEIV